MDDSKGRRTATGIIFTKGGCSITCSEQKYHDKSIRYCSRLGCCASIYSMKDTQVAEREKVSFRSGSAKSLASSGCREPRREQRAKRSTEEADIAESSSRRGDSNKLKCSSRSKSLRPHIGFNLVSENATEQVGSCSPKRSSRTSKEVTRKPRHFSKENSGTSQSSSSRGKSIISSPKGTNSGRSVSPPERLASPQTPRRSRNQYTNTGAVSVRTRCAPAGTTRTRPSGQVDESISVPDPVTSATRQSLGVSGAVPQSSSRSSRDFHRFYQNIHERPESSTRTTHRRPIHEPLTNDATSEDSNAYPQLNILSVAEVLLELERIEQDEGLTYEWLPSLGNHLYSLSFHDQYRDMRMDIDDMTYEELLALGEKMGTVSTALTEEALAKCLKRRNYMAASAASGLDEVDVKCSICQEEYEIGDELGRLVCEHFYHVTCIHQWLRLKNWCPICKACVCPTP